MNSFSMTAEHLRQPMSAALAAIRARTSVTLAFGGTVDSSGSVSLDHFSGRDRGALRGVRLASGQGLGGKATALRRGVTVNGYLEAPYITHSYDHIIMAEGLRSIVAVPVIVKREVVATVYGAFHNDEIIGSRIEHALAEEARALEQNLVARRSAAETDATSHEAVRLRQELRSAAESVQALMAMEVGEDAERRLVAIAERLLEFSSEPAPTPQSSASGITLTMRERDVLALAGAGLPNAVIADTLGLTLYTVKSYIKTAMNKLGGRTRIEAFLIARSSGLLR